MMNDNKLIAEFMSGDFKVNAHYGINIDFLKDNITAKQLENDLRYDKSWDWLMPVVEKIESHGIDFFIVDNRVKIAHNTDHSIDIILDSVYVGGKMTATYKAVVEFIKQYNESNKMDNLPPHVQ